MRCDEATLQLAGYVDGELPLPARERLDMHVVGCAACKRERIAQQFVRREVQREATRHRAPESLRRRLRALGARREERAFPGWLRLPGWGWLAPTAVAVAASLTMANVVVLATAPTQADRVADDVVGSHMRALMTSRPIDVASSDRHTVKPWFSGKLDFSPPVSDFAAQGFALAGGRLEYVDGRSVAALVYQRREHAVDVFVWPCFRCSGGKPEHLARRGYNVVHWVRDDMSYWMVSDLEANELAALRALLDAGSAM
jgi:anti-sigma factor RsiW